MTKHYQEKLEQIITALEHAQDALWQAAEENDIRRASAILEECQTSAIAVGNAVEETEGEGTDVVKALEAYCELIYQIHTAVQSGQTDIELVFAEKLSCQLQQICKELKEIKTRREVVFCPYKAAMWDSLESIWMAFDADPTCDAYVIPIPYYEKNSDGSFGKMHYERSLFPEKVPMISFEAYDFENRRPDAIYVHNPYDGANHVTSIHPSFYSDQLTRYTDALFYVPYYVVSGDTSDFGMYNPVNVHADYIVMQSKRNREGYPAELPDDKFLPLGSPKLDKVIRLCNNPPEIPDAWKGQMEGKKVYFYNTSISGMLADTKKFLLKMEYVFRTFRGREDACLVWRPHPLLETTFESMRADFKPFFEELKRAYVRDQIGILDTTPDIEQTIALSDAYIGDTGTSVTALFGIAGKPIFALNNWIREIADEEKKLGEKAVFLAQQENGKWLITLQNQLYKIDETDGRHHFVSQLSEYASGAYYQKAIAVGDKLFVCPRHAMDVLVVDAENGKTVEKLALANPIYKGAAFANAIYTAPYIFLIPVNYGAIVRIDTRTHEMQYVEGCNHVFVDMIGDELRAGGACVWGEYLLIASPTNNQVLAIHKESLKPQLLSTGADESLGCLSMIAYPDEIYLMPTNGVTVCAWNPDTGQLRAYEHMPESLLCIQMFHGYQCMERPFANAIRIGKMLYLSPYWANQFVAIDLESGQSRRMQISDQIACQETSGYFYAEQIGAFIPSVENTEIVRFMSDVERAYYEVDLLRDSCEKHAVTFEQVDLDGHEPGFDKISQWFLYGCEENAQNSLKDFLDGTLTGKPFDKEKQLEAFGYIAENLDGTCGQKVYEFTKKLWDGNKA